MARAAVGLAEIRATLGDFEDIPFEGHTISGEELRTGFSQITGRKLRLSMFPWLMMKMLSPVWGLAREMQEMRYLWETPHSLNGARMQQLLPKFEATNQQDILKAVVAG